MSTENGSLSKKVDTIANEADAVGLSAATVSRQRRLKAYHPKLWAEVEAGTKSTHAAAIAAGIVKVPSGPHEPLDAAYGLIPSRCRRGNGGPVRRNARPQAGGLPGGRATTRASMPAWGGGGTDQGCPSHLVGAWLTRPLQPFWRSGETQGGTALFQRCNTAETAST